ncbi:MAG: hypothetical protein U0M96_05125 [Eggerthellaceae bacterium]
MDDQLEILKANYYQDELRKKAAIAHRVFLVISCISIFFTCASMIPPLLTLAGNNQEAYSTLIVKGAFFSSELTNAVVLTVALLALAGLFKDAARSISPISIKQSKRLILIGSLLLLSAAIEILSQIAFPDISIAAATGDQLSIRLYSISSESDSLYVDFQSIFGAVFCYCLSFVFKYATHLQNLSNDTI